MTRLRRTSIVALVLVFVPLFASAHEIWVAPTYQQDFGGVGIASNAVLARHSRRRRATRVGGAE